MSASRHGLLQRSAALLLSGALSAGSSPLYAARQPSDPGQGDDARRAAPASRPTLQALADYDILARDRRSPRGVASTGGRTFFTDEAEGRLYEITTTGAVESRVSGLRSPRGLITEPSGGLLLVAEGHEPARGASGLILSYDPGSRRTEVVARGLRHPRGLTRAADGTLFVTAEGLIEPGERDEHRCEDHDGDDDDDDHEGSAHTGTVFRWSAAGGFAPLASGFKRPEGVVVEADGTLLVAAERYRSGQRRHEGSVFRVGRTGEVTVRFADRLKRPTGLARDAAGDLYLSGEKRVHRGSHPGVILKLHAGATPIEFARGLMRPRGLAGDSPGELLAADEKAGLVVRFRGPTPPTLRLPDAAATNQDPFPLAGTAEVGAVVLVRGGREEVRTSVGTDGSFSVSMPLHHNQANALEAAAIGRGGEGMAGAPTRASLVHDDVAPLLTAASDPAPNASGWNRTDVQVSFTCSDGASGVASCPASQRVGAEGAGQEVAGTATDRAGNRASARIFLNIDKTPPVPKVREPEADFATNADALPVSGHVVESNPVTVSVNGVAAELSGDAPARDFTAPNVPLGDAAEVSLEAKAEDAAGNVGTAHVRGRIDRIAPEVRITSPHPDAYVSGGSLRVTGAVNDATPTMVQVNGIPALCGGTPICVSAGGPAVFAVDVPIADGRLPIMATALDAARNEGSARTEIVVDSVAPLIALNEPADDFVTRAATVRVAGTVTDASPVTLKVAGGPVPVSGGAFSADVPLGGEGPVALMLEATDAAGNSRTHEVNGLVDRTPPELQIVSPALTPEGPTPVGSLPLLVQGLASDRTPVTVAADGVAAAVTSGVWQASLLSLAEGEHRIEVVATDRAGNAATATREVVVDLGPPIITITSPLPSLTREGTLTVTGSVEDRSKVSLTINDAAAPLSSGPGTFTFTAEVPLVEGDNTLHIVATDATGRSARVEPVPVVTRDSVAPTIELQASDRVSRGRPGQATATAADNLAVSNVVFKLDGVPLATLTALPYTVPLTVPAGASAGDTLTLTVEATDTAGNSASASRGVRVSADGVVVGQVLSDATGLPLAGASIGLPGGGPAVPTDDRGRYSIPTGDLSAVLRVEKEAMTTVEREVMVASGTGTVPIDARLTSLAEAVTIGGDGGTLTAGPVTVTVPSGAAGSYRLTALSPQGLPGLLPLGFSPLAGFDLREDAGSLPGMSATIADVSGAPLHLVRYSASLHAWRMEAANLPATSGSITVALPGSGAFALVAADPGEQPILIPDPGEMLEGVLPVTVPATATGTGGVDPAIIPPTGATARGLLSVASAEQLPSGTVLQAEVAETYTLASGDVASEENRLQDIIIYRGPSCPPGASLCAAFPVSPSRTYPPTDLISGKVHLDVLTGRENSRGAVGGSDAVTLEAADARLSVPARALAEDTALSLEAQALSSFLPSSSGLVPLAEVVLDFSSLTLSIPAELSVGSGSVSPGDTLLVAGVERLDGIPRLVIVALAEAQGDRIVSQSHPNLPGVTKGGRYVFYRAPSALGFVSGITSSMVGAVKAVVEAAAWPFVALGRVDGRYTLPLPVGSASLTARVLGTSLSGSGTALVSAGETASLNLLLAGAVTAATVQPASGSVALPTNTQVEIATTVPLNPATVTADNVKLLNGDTPVAVRLVLSGSGKNLAVIPQQALEFSTDYTLQASGLADAFGGLVSVPPASFRTKDDVPPQYQLDAIGFSFPNAEGIVAVSAPAGTLPPGTQVLIINAANGVVLSLTAGNDGSLSGELPASTSDQLFITVTDPLGNTLSFTRSKFVNAETGETAIGPGGGTVTGEGGVELRIPDAALDKGVSFKISVVTDTELPALFPNQQLDQLTESIGAFYGGMLKLEASGAASFKKEADLVFPLPDFTKAPADKRPANPKDAFFYVHRRIERCPDDAASCAAAEKLVQFEVIDEARVEGEGPNAKVVTASPPFPGLVGALSGAVSLFTLSWGYDVNSPARPGPGLITGKVLRQLWNPGAMTPEYEQIAGASVSSEDASGVPLHAKDGGTFATTQTDGSFVLWDLRYVGGVAAVVATHGGQTARGTAFESLGDSRLERYKASAKANVTFPAVEPPLVPPRVEVKVFRAFDGRDTSGITTVGTPLVIGLKNNTPETTFSVQTVDVQGRPHSVRMPLPNDPPGLSHVLNEPYTPPQPGTYTVAATALPPVGPPVDLNATFRVIAEGGGIDNDPGSAPRVITARTRPAEDAQGVPVTVFPEVAFTEPVRKVSGDGMALIEPDGTKVELTLSGVTPEGVVIENLTGDDEVVTSVTLRPLHGLKHSTAYRLMLSAAIEDLDTDAAGNPAPKNLIPYETSFTTFGPTDLGRSAEQTGSTGIVVLGERAYLTRTNSFASGNLLAFDVSNPALPLPVGEPVFFAPGPRDIAGEQTEDGQRLIAVAAGSPNPSKPASVLFFDATTDEIKWVGASSVTNSTQEGFITRLAMKGGFAYTATLRRGIQVVQVTRNLEGLDAAALQNARTAINTEGSGFGQDAVAQTIPLPTKQNGTDYYLSDLKVGEIQGQTLVVASGEPGIVIANPQTGSILYPQTFPTVLKTAEGSYTLGWGLALSLGRLSDRDLAVILTRSHLVSMDLSDPAAPRIMGHIDLTDQLGGLSPIDVILKGDTALVSAQSSAAADGRVLLVSLAAPTRPAVVGTLSGRGGRLALGTGGLSNVLFSSGYSPFGGENPLGGVRAATFGAVVLLLDKHKKPLPRIKLPKNFETYVEAVLPGAGDAVEGLEVSIVGRDGNVRTKSSEIPTLMTLTLQRDPVTGRYIAPVKIVDKDCAIELDHNEIDEQVIKTPCKADLESGPWTRLRIKVPEIYGGLERMVDIHAFRLVALGDSLTQGVQHGTVVHQDQRHSYPAQLAGQINELLKMKYGQQVVFKQAMISEPGIGTPPLRASHGDGPGDSDNDGFANPGRLNHPVQPVNNLGMSGARVAHLHTAKHDNWPRYRDETPWLCKGNTTCDTYPSPILNPDEPKSVWRYVLAPPEAAGEKLGTAVDQACELDPSLLLIFIGNNDALNAPVASNMDELTDVRDFQDRYNALMDSVLRCTGGRASIVVGTIPDVSSIPHMRNVGEIIGAMPFTVPGVPAFEDEATHLFEKMRLSSVDESGECLARDSNGLCFGGKIGIATIGKVMGRQGKLGQALQLARQSDLLRLAIGWKDLFLQREDVMRPSQLQEVQARVDAFNRHITERWAQRNGWVVMDMNQFFRGRTATEAKNDPTLLNGLFTGTERPIRREGDDFKRGMGNTLFGWDGVHPNSAGYSVAANEAIRALVDRLKESDYGGLEKGAVIEPVPEATITELLKENYLKLNWSRLYDWQSLLTTVR